MIQALVCNYCFVNLLLTDMFMCQIFMWSSTMLSGCFSGRSNHRHSSRKQHERSTVWYI